MCVVQQRWGRDTRGARRKRRGSARDQAVRTSARVGGIHSRCGGTQVRMRWLRTRSRTWRRSCCVCVCACVRVCVCCTPAAGSNARQSAPCSVARCLTLPPRMRVSCRRCSPPSPRCAVMCHLTPLPCCHLLPPAARPCPALPARARVCVCGSRPPQLSLIAPYGAPRACPRGVGKGRGMMAVCHHLHSRGPRV